MNLKNLKDQAIFKWHDLHFSHVLIKLYYNFLILTQADYVETSLLTQMLFKLLYNQILIRKGIKLGLKWILLRLFSVLSIPIQSLSKLYNFQINHTRDHQDKKLFQLTIY